MRFPGTRSSTASTILQQGGQQDDLRLARSRSRQARNAQIQAAILAGGNLAGDIVRTIPQFQANTIRESEGQKDRDFENALKLAEREAAFKLQENEQTLERELAPQKYRKPPSAFEQAMAAVQGAQVAGKIQTLQDDPRFPADQREAAIQGLTAGKPTPEYQAYYQKKAQAAPLERAATEAGLPETDLIGRLDPGAFQGMTRGKYLDLIGSLALEGGETNPAIAQVIQASGGKIPDYGLLDEGLLEIMNPFDMGTEQAQSELQRLVEATQSQQPNVGPKMKPQPLSPATRAWLLERLKRVKATGE